MSFRSLKPYRYLTGAIVIDWNHPGLHGRHESGEGVQPEDIESLHKTEYMEMWAENGKPFLGKRGAPGMGRFPFAL